MGRKRRGLREKTRRNGYERERGERVSEGREVIGEGEREMDRQMRCRRWNGYRVKGEIER